MKYKVGDRVIASHSMFSVVKKPGTIRGLDGTIYCIEFDEFMGGHDCATIMGSGRIKVGYGSYLRDEDISGYIGEEKKEEKVMGKKFGVGDKVAVKYLADMISDYGTDGEDLPKVPYGFNSDMAKMCGKEYTIEKVDGDRISLVGQYWNWHENMLMLKEKAKPTPAKKKITVAEIEKALGYGVEIIKG
jgi:hypothetical protein